ncbi:helix-turn-helix transcriptional regulator [Streptomyces uncialis]|uniref:helix-turn-helix transcriptional regulator n=1 Tax=Streptomyces uncialis TaxID=1048205 RepID=UPI0037FAC296
MTQKCGVRRSHLHGWRIGFSLWHPPVERGEGMASKRVRLSQRRKSAGFTQETLAARLGVERTTVIRWETAVSEPP